MELPSFHMIRILQRLLFLHNLMEDAATAEISRAQVWQWIRHPKGILEDGRKITEELFHQIKEEELAVIKSEVEKRNPYENFKQWNT